MADLHIRNLPPEMYERLREQARRNVRSVSAEAVAILRVALPDDDRSSSQRVRRRLREVQARNILPEDAPTAAELIRDDRNTR